MFGASMRERAGHREARGRAAGRRCENGHIWLVGEGAAARAAAKGRRRREVWRRRGRAVASGDARILYYGISLLRQWSTATTATSVACLTKAMTFSEHRRWSRGGPCPHGVEMLRDSRLTPHARDAADASLSQSYIILVRYTIPSVSSLARTGRGAAGARRAARGVSCVPQGAREDAADA